MRFLRSHLISVGLAVLVFSCTEPVQNNSATAPKPPSATILQPLDNYEYDPYNPIYLIFQYDTTKWLPTFDWTYSKDEGKTWQKISIVTGLNAGTSANAQSRGDAFKYDVRTWRPELDTLEENIDIWIRVGAYGGTSTVIKKGIKIRKPE